MKTLILVGLMALSGGLCAAQSPPANAAPGVAVVESGWRRRLVRNPALDEDQLRPLEDQARAERIRAEVVRQNAIRAAAGRDQAALPARNAVKSIPPPRAAYPYYYVYRVKIVNTGAKKIRGLVWEYVLLDPSTGSEVGRHGFTSTTSVRPGKNATLYGLSTLPPADTVDAMKAGEGSEGQYSERVVITRIYYDDSVWERGVE